MTISAATSIAALSFVKLTAQRIRLRPMYLVPIAWLYVTVMMAVAEATSSTGTLLGAIITFGLYGVAPVSLVMYLMRTPALPFFWSPLPL